MSIRRATLSGTVPGRSVRTLTPPWFGAGSAPVLGDAPGFVTPSTGATVNTKGSWTQVIASTTAEHGLLWIYPFNSYSFGSDNGVLMDVGVGASGSEQVIVPNLAYAGYGSFPIPVPVRIPSGSRVAVRIQTALASKSQSPFWYFTKQAHSLQTPTAVDVLGSSTSTSRGTAMAGSSGSYTEIISSTTRPYQALVIVPSAGGTTGQNATVKLTAAVGAAGSEVDVGEFYFLQSSSGVINQTSTTPSWMAPIGGHVPAGSRISIKHNMSANPGYIQACVIGVPYP